MLTRALGVSAVVVAGLVPSCQPACEPPPVSPPRDVDEVVALVVDGLDTAWTRVIDADLVETRYGLGSLVEVVGEGAQVRLVGTAAERTVSAAELDAAYSLPSSRFAIQGVTRDRTSNIGFTFIGDSLGVSITSGSTDELPALLDGVFVAPRYDAVGGRCTADPGCVSTGLDAAERVPGGAGVVVMELGINDAIGSFDTKIDQVMNELVGKGVGPVVWLTSSTRSSYAHWADERNATLVAAAQGRWNGVLQVADWNAHSSGASKNHWFQPDLIHLTSTGQAELALFIRDAVIAVLPPPPEPPPTTEPAPPEPDPAP